MVTIGVDFAERALCELPRQRSERPFEATILPIVAVRRALAERLSDCATVGEITASGNGAFSYSYDGGSGGYGEDPDAVPEGTVMPLRRCDLLAGQIANVSRDESIHYRLDWSEAKRDQELDALKEWLRTETD